jgi:hypothetical protein
LVLPSDEDIIEELIGPDRTWDDLHHRSYFFLKLRRVEAGEFVLTMTGDMSSPIDPLATHVVYAEGNMESIAKMIPIDISRTHGVMDNVFVWVEFSAEEIQIYTYLFKEFHEVFSWSYEEMSNIDPRIAEHEIKTYPDVNLFLHKLHPVNPRKATSIKVEVEKLLKVDFIFPV